MSVQWMLWIVFVTWVQAAPPRPPAPTRDPHGKGYVEAQELPDGTVPPADADGNFIIGPTHPAAAETKSRDLDGTVYTFTMSSADSRIYPGIARDRDTFGIPDPGDPAKLIVTTSHPFPYTRRVAVYVPKQYVPGTAAPFIVGADGPDPLLFNALDALIAQKKVPVMIAISIANGSGDAQAASVASSTTRCRAATPNSSRTRCCRSSRSSTG
jgi:enterochelin esterase family protein